MASNITTAELIKKASLSFDQADLVQGLLASKEAYAAYLKVARREVEGMESEVVTMSSARGSEAVFQAKLRAEGARQLLKALENLVTYRR